MTAHGRQYNFYEKAVACKSFDMYAPICISQRCQTSSPMHLQLQDRDSEQIAVRPSAIDARARTRASGGRDLIHEEGDITADVLAMYVCDLGYTDALHASAKSGAVVAAEKVVPDLILADVRIGDGGDGMNAVRRANKKSWTDLVFVTAHPQLTCDEAKAALPKADLTGDRLSQAIEAALLIGFVQ